MIYEIMRYEVFGIGLHAYKQALVYKERSVHWVVYGGRRRGRRDEVI